MGRRSSTQTTRGDATLRDARVISRSTVNRQTTGCRGKTAKPAYLASGGLRAEESIAPDPARDSARWDGKTPGHAMGPLTAPSGHLPTLAVLLRMLPSRPGRRQGRRRGLDEDEGEQQAASRRSRGWSCAPHENGELNYPRI